MSQGSGEKTEKATSKKRRDARNRGQVLKSTELNIALCSLIMLGFMMLIFPTGINQLSSVMKGYLTSVYITGTVEVSVPIIRQMLMDAMIRVGLLSMPSLLCALIVGLLVNFLQVGFLFTTETIKPSFSKINPIQGFKRMFSMRTFVELVKSILKIWVLGYILYSDYIKLIDKFPALIGLEVYVTFLEIINIAFTISLKMAFALLVIAGFDYLFQWWKFEKDLMMTKQEVKDEYKLTEGDPVIKGRIKQKQRQMSQMRMMQAVPQADVVITNPTHYAVALKYNEGEGGAPMVVAKGLDFVARKIKEIAAENGIELVENKPLAQALYSMCEVGDEIPPEFYQAVADILVYVYKQKGKR